MHGFIKSTKVLHSIGFRILNDCYEHFSDLFKTCLILLGYLTNFGRKFYFHVCYETFPELQTIFF